MNLKLSDLLFQATKNVIECSAKPVRTGMADSTGAYAAVKARPAVAKGAAKINNAAVVLDLLDQKRINALYAEDNASLYVEFESRGVRYKAIVTGFAKERFCFLNNCPAEYWEYHIPLFVYALANPDFKYTQEEFAKVVKDLLDNKKITDQGSIFTLCDSYYYEAKDCYPEYVNHEDKKTATDEEIKQLLRTGGYAPIDALSVFGENLMPLSVQVDTKPVKEEKSPTVSAAETFKTAKMGGFMTDYTFSLEDQSKIPSLDILDEFIPIPQFYRMLKLAFYNQGQVYERMQNPEIGYGVKAIGNDYTNILMSGRPGTGKTTTAFALAAALGMPIDLVGGLSKNTEEDQFQGMTKVSEGGFKFFKGKFLERYVNGGIALLDDINRCPAGVAAMLLDAIEKPFILMEDGYIERRRHPMFILIATMNVGTMGTTPQNQALISRLAQGCAPVLNDPTKDDFLAILMGGSGMDKKLCSKVYGVYVKILEYLKSSHINAEDIALSLTTRQCLSALKLIKIGISFKEAIQDSMIGVIACQDNELAIDVYDNVVAMMPD